MGITVRELLSMEYFRDFTGKFRVLPWQMHRMVTGGNRRRSFASPRAMCLPIIPILSGVCFTENPKWLAW